VRDAVTIVRGVPAANLFGTTATRGARTCRASAPRPPAGARPSRRPRRSAGARRRDLDGF
jgi:hypothetical protein